MQGRIHKPVLNPELCGTCEVCRGACPAQTFGDLAHEEETIRGQLAKAVSGRDPAGPPPCRDACPLKQDIPGYIRCLAQGNQTRALEVILEHNPLPAVLGHVCHHPCQDACASAPVQRPPAVRELKLFASLAPRPQVKLSRDSTRTRVAVVGSGPAGLAAAWILAGQGVKVTIYEAQQVAGGMLAWAIPPFRLPREALEEDIAYVLNHGVDLKLNTCLEPEEVLGLRRENSAVILACGSPRAKEIDLPGSDIPHVWLGLDFLRQAALGSLSEIKGPVVVIGGGNVAMDAARWCLRLTEDVTLAYRRDRQQMTAYAEEVEAAIGEGLKLVFRVQPATIESGDDSRPAFVQFLETAPAEMDEGGRRNFAPIAGKEKSLLAKTVILALGQKNEAGIWATGLGLEAITPNPQGLITTGLYAAGDLVTGPATVVEAMAGGIACARHILQGVAS